MTRVDEANFSAKAWCLEVILSTSVPSVQPKGQAKASICLAVAGKRTLNYVSQVPKGPFALPTKLDEHYLTKGSGPNGVV